MRPTLIRKYVTGVTLRKHERPERIGILLFDDPGPLENLKFHIPVGRNS